MHNPLRTTHDGAVTGHRLVAFDPTRKYFAEPLLVEFGHGGDESFADTYPDFCRPFLAYGITFREEYRGTLFRIPLRTKVEQVPTLNAKPDP